MNRLSKIRPLFLDLTADEQLELVQKSRANRRAPAPTRIVIGKLVPEKVGRKTTKKKAAPQSLADMIGSLPEAERDAILAELLAKRKP